MPNTAGGFCLPIIKRMEWKQRNKESYNIVYDIHLFLLLYSFICFFYSNRTKEHFVSSIPFHSLSFVIPFVIIFPNKRTFVSSIPFHSSRHTAQMVALAAGSYIHRSVPKPRNLSTIVPKPRKHLTKKS